MRIQKTRHVFWLPGVIAQIFIFLLAWAPSAAIAAIVAGRTPTTFAVTDSGAASYAIPIWSPPGVGDVQLKLGLAYNSRSPNGVLGMGWSLSGLSAITRCSRTWIQDGAPQRVLLTMGDRFCLDGQQLKLVSGIYGQAGSKYATEVESFSRIVANGVSGNGPASFTVTSKNGLVYEYGSTSDSQIKPGGGATIRTWALSRIHDRVGVNGNSISLTYTNDTANNTYRIASIAYPTTASGQGPFYEVDFAYAARPANDVPSSYASGFLSREPNRLTTITIRNFGSSTATKRYDLTYNQGTATNRSRLNTIQECSAINCLPATAIVYQNGTTGWSSTLSTTGVTTSNSPVSGPIPIDLNGDGLTDIFYPKAQTSSTSHWWAILATATGFGTAIDTGVITTNVSLEIVGAFSGTGKQQVLLAVSGYWKVVQYNNSTANFTATSTGVPAGSEYAAVDYDGDGLPDLASIVGTEFRVRRNTTVTPNPVTFASTAEAIFTYTGGWSIAGGTSYWLRLSDYNGDGRGDLYFLTYFNTGFGNVLQGEVLLSNGFGAQATNSSHLASPGWTTLPGDWNADGCTDIVGSTLNISDCAGGFSRISGGVATTTSILAADWDGDSRVDLLYLDTLSNTWYFKRSTGEGVAPAVSTGIAAPLGTAWFVFDKDGDGLLDGGYVDSAANYAIKYRLHNGATIPPDLATSFTDGYGINASPVYKTISKSNYTKYTDAQFPEQDFQGPLYVVGQFTASDGIGGTYQNTFYYWGARLHVQGRGFEGFYARRTIDSRNGLYDYNYFGRTFPYTGMLIGRTLSQSTGPEIRKLVSVQNSQLKGAAGYEQRVFPFLSPITETEHELGGAIDTLPITERVTTRTFGDSYGNPTLVVTATTDQDASSPFYNSTWTTTVSTTYENYVAENCLGLPLTLSVESAVPSQTTETRSYSYDNDTSLCRMKQEIIEPTTPAQKVTTTITFDPDCGNAQLIEVTGSKPDGSAMPIRATQVDFGTRCQLPEKLTNALLQETRFAYFYDFGVLESVSDPNSFLTSWQVDDFGRRTREDRPDGTGTVWTYTRCATLPCWGSADLRLQVTEDLRTTADANFNTRQLYFDGLERLRSDEIKRAFGILTKNVTTYDSLGRMARRYQPYSSAQNGYLEFAYDALNRKKTEKLYTGTGALDRTTSFDYAGRTTGVTDPLLRVFSQVRDVAGHRRQVADPPQDGGTTVYDYDAFGNLNKITDSNTPSAAISTGTYNLRGFMTQWADADRGTWSFTPNSMNELVSWTNAKQQQFSAEYDPLGRLTKRTEPEGVSNFVWGSIATQNNIGALKSQSGYGYTEAYAYDGSGRLSTRTITSDQSYTYSYTYNSIGALSAITYPISPIPNTETVNRFRILYDYSFGVPYRIRDITDPAAYKTIWRLNSSNDYSSPLTETLGETTTATVTSGYKAWTNELTSLMSGVSPSTNNRQNLAYTWDTVGNLTRRQDLGQNLSELFVPDSLNRVLSSTRNADPPITISYNPAGNIKNKSDVSGTDYNYTTAQTGCTYYSHPQPHAVRKAGSVVYCYDANGNVVKRGGLTQSWASFDLPTTLQASVGGTTYQSAFAYGPSHQRWRQIGTYSDGTETTYYVGGLLEKVTSTAAAKTYWRHYVNTPTGLTIIVSRNSDNSKYITYAMSDHLGSSDAIIDGITGALRTRESFDAWGARRGSDWKPTTAPDWTAIAGATRRGFTFHEMLDNIKLTHMNGRVYDPSIGRFMSVDPIIGSIADSQQVNPYAYVGNRPLSFIDPSGFDLNDPNGGPDDNSPGGGQGAPVASWDWYGDLFSDIGHFLGDLFGLGSGPPPPPPASAWPGTSAQNGVNMCDPGISSQICGGMITTTTWTTDSNVGSIVAQDTVWKLEDAPIVTVGRTLAVDVFIVKAVLTGNDAEVATAIEIMEENAVQNKEVLIILGTMGRGRQSGARIPGQVRTHQAPENAAKSVTGGKALLGRNPQAGGTRTNTDLPGDRATAKSIFRNQTRGQDVSQTTMPNGGIRRTATDRTQIRMNPDGTTRLDLPVRGPLPNGETMHIPPRP